jgi:hypothetical protein
MSICTFYQGRMFTLESEEFPIESQIFSVNKFDKKTYSEKKGIDLIYLSMINVQLMFSQFNETYQEIKKSSEIYNNIFDNNVELIKRLSERNPGCIEAFNQLKREEVTDGEKKLSVEKLLERLMNDVYTKSNGFLLVEVSTQTISSFDEEETIENRDIKYVQAYIRRYDFLEIYDNFEKVIHLFLKYKLICKIILDSLNYIIKENNKNL